jgi:hypothetical protein
MGGLHFASQDGLNNPTTNDYPPHPPFPLPRVQLTVSKESDGVLVPIPQYPLYSAGINEKKWHVLVCAHTLSLDT